ncbi:MAG TPA: enolase C-terminal domain-like protein [Thermomicrobiales bacterium]|nr:enolase C-terminal domain-like protein [Thermomicrobiales bacterium]
MKITGVTLHAVRPDTTHAKSWLSQTLIANPMSIYPEYKGARESWNAAWGPDLLVRIQTDAGLEGIGATVPAGARAIIQQHFQTLLLGQDPFDIEKLWDQMFRSSLPYGRKGLAIMAISAVDVALWDIVGKATGQPIYRLLGGAVRESLPTYSTGNDIAYFRELGFRGFKLAMPHGPDDGWDGIRKNVELIEWARDIVGPDSDLMLDCYMAWNVDFTLRMSREVERLNVRWIEECLPPDDFEGYAEITAKSRVPIATGEHEYTRWGFKELIARRCCHILQPDLAWVGGISEAKKIAAMASAWGVDVIPHAGGLQPWGVHFMISTVNCPRAEWVVVGNKGEADAARSMLPHLTNTPVPIDGRIRPNEEPGIGCGIDEQWLMDAGESIEGAPL